MSVTALDSARASYLWQLRSQRPLVADQLADLTVAFRWLLSVHLDEEIAELATLYTRLVSAELDRAAALMPPAPPGAERCARASARTSRSP